MVENIKTMLTDYRIFLIIVFIAFVIDFITGITKAVYNKSIQSEKLKKTIPKLIGYASVLVIGVCIEIIFPEAHFITKSLSIFIIIIEFISTIENIKSFVKIPKFLTVLLETKKDDLTGGGAENVTEE